MRIWHPKVHALFGEKLHYYLLTIRPFNLEDFRKKVEIFTKEHGIGGFCFYEVFGAFDVLLRVWVPALEEDKFMDRLRTVIPEIERTLPFRVTNIANYWLRDEVIGDCGERALDLVTVDRVRAVQNHAHAEETDILLSSKLLADVKPTQDVKFFVVLSNPQPVTRTTEDRFQRELSEIINKFRGPANKLFRVSLYFGYGFAWALIKAETSPDNYFLVGGIVNELNRRLYGFNFFTNTYLATGPDNFETDNISISSITSAGGIDLTIARLLPDFYKLEIPADLREQITRWVHDHRAVDNLNDQQKVLITRALSGVIAQNEMAIFAAIQEYFVEQERYLRAQWRRFVDARAQDVKEILRGAGIPQSTNARYFALGELCNIYAQSIRQSASDSREKELTSGWQEVANLRNIVAHGGCNPIEEWPVMLQGLIESFSKLDLLRRVIDSAVKIESETSQPVNQ